MLNIITKMLKSYIILSIGLLYILLPSPLYSAEVEEIEESEIPLALEETIELKKESEFKLIPLVDITALGTYSKVSDGNDLGGADIKGSFAPVYRIDKKNYIIPLYYVSYNRERQVTVEEEGGRVYNELMNHNLTLEYKHILNEKTTLKLDGLLRYHYVKESGYDWSKGLYDYEDLGIAGSVEYFFVKERTQRRSFSIGGEFYQREYPNYASLIALASVTAPETNEKDYKGYRPILRYNYLNEGLGCSIFYSPLYKDFDDKKVIDSNGVLTSDEREDWFHYANIKLSYLLEDTPLLLGLGLTGILVDSNQNYYDSKGTVGLGDDVATENYYSFKSLSLNPTPTYLYKFEDKKTPATFTLGYAYLIRDYDDRKAQRSDSTYTDDTQLDQTHTVSLEITYPINEHISAIALASYTKGLSNMKYESYYRYRYDSSFLGGGLRIKY